MEKSKFFDKETHYHLGRPGHASSIGTFLAKNFDADKTCLEIGAGNGRGTKILADHFAKVISIEPVANLAARGQEVFDLDNVELHVMPIENAGDFEFDFLICFQATHWFYKSDQYQKYYLQARKPILDIQTQVSLEQQDFFGDLVDTFKVKDAYRGVDYPRHPIYESSYEASFSVEKVTHGICSTSWIDHESFEAIYKKIHQRFQNKVIRALVTTKVQEVESIEHLI